MSSPPVAGTAPPAPAVPPSERASPSSALPPHIAALRRRGAAGGIIAQHRALKRIRVAKRDRLSSAGLAAAFVLLWLLVLPWVARLWRAMFAWLGGAVGLPGGVVTTHYDGGLLLPSFDLPTIAAAAPAAPASMVWWVTAAVTALVLIGSLFLPERATPLTYLLRATAALQVSALVYMAVRPSGLPYLLPAYVETLLWGGIGLIGLVPVLYGFTYYIFDFGVPKKAGLTAATMLHLSVFLPVQCLVQAYLLHHLSLLFLPVLFILFGILLEVMLVVAFYAWGMSWLERGEAEYMPPRAGGPPAAGGAAPKRLTAPMLRWVAQRSQKRAPSSGAS